MFINRKYYTKYILFMAVIVLGLIIGIFSVFLLLNSLALRIAASFLLLLIVSNLLSLSFSKLVEYEK